MTITASNLGVTPASSLTASLQTAYNKVVSSISSAVNIGSLTENASSLNVLSRLSSQIPADYYSFNFTSGSAIKLGFNNLSNSADLRVQLYDSVGNVVADSNGTDTQTAAYASLTSSDGLTAGTGKYYVKVGYVDTKSVTPQDYNFQLYSGSSFDSTLTTSALSQAYDPNLFVSVKSTVAAAANETTYTRAATLAYSAALDTATNIGSLVKNKSALAVTGKVNAGVPVDDYSFAANQDGPIKFGFTNVTDTSSLRVKILDSAGKVVADSLGTDEQKYAYQQLTSGAGLNVKKGNYTVQVGYESGALTSKDQKYNFQLYSGTSYSDLYTTTAAPPANNSKTYRVGDNLAVYSDISATTSSRSDFNRIKAKPSDAINVGWLQKDTTSLEVVSQLTSGDNVDYYKFTLQSGDSFKLRFKNLTDKSLVRVQILDPSGYGVFADNQGTTDQKKAFDQLTSDSGLKASTGNYLVKVSYDTHASSSKTTSYSFDLYSGTKFNTQYKTIASAQTVGNFLLSGGTFAPAAAAGMAGFLTDTSNGTSVDAFAALSAFV